MAVPVFLDDTVLELLSAHVVGDRPVPSAHEWAVEDLHLLLARFSGQLAFRVGAPLAARHAAALEQVAGRYDIPYEVLSAGSDGTPAVQQALVEAGAPAALASRLALCARKGVRYFLQAAPPADAVRDRVFQSCGVRVVDPMHLLSHLYARLMGRGQVQQDGGG